MVTLIKSLSLPGPQLPLLYYEEHQLAPGPSWWLCRSVLGAWDGHQVCHQPKTLPLTPFCLAHLPPTTAVPR